MSSTRSIVVSVMHSSPRNSQTNERIVLLAIRIGLLAFLIYWSFVLLRPFIPILVWSVVLAVALYPACDWLSKRLGGRMYLAAIMITVLNLIIIIGPMAWLGIGLLDGLRDLSQRMVSDSLALPLPPESIRGWPIVGQSIYDFWSAASLNFEAALKQVAPYLKPLAAHILSFAGSAGVGLLIFLLSIVASGFVLWSPFGLVEAGRKLLSRVISQRTEEFLALATTTIRSVSLGVIGIALLQALLVGIGLKAIGLSSAGILAFAVLMLGVLQVGPAIILIPLVIWIWSARDFNTALVMTIFLGIVGLADNILKPMLMGRGLRTPMPVIFIGVLGGTLAHGLVGLFIGPIVLAVAWEILFAWINEAKPAPVDEPINPR